MPSPEVPWLAFVFWFGVGAVGVWCIGRDVFPDDDG